MASRLQHAAAGNQSRSAPDDRTGSDRDKGITSLNGRCVPAGSGHKVRTQPCPAPCPMVCLNPGAVGGSNKDVRTKILYIMGSGRSGSTLLDTVLSDQPGMFGAGELCNLLSAMDVRHNYCACGRRSAECPVWLAVRAEWSRSAVTDVAREYPALQRRVERIRNYPRHRGSTSESFTERYLELTRALFAAIANVSGATTIVDSSKGPVRALALSRMHDVDLRVIHLVRDVRGVAYSTGKRFASDPKGGIMSALNGKSSTRTAANWMLVNAVANRVRARLGERATLVRYEDFVTRPAQILRRLSEFSGVDFAATAEKLERGRGFKAGHTIEGNRLRMHDRIELRPDIRWREHMSKTKQSLLPLLTAPVAWGYGYHPR